VTIEAANKLRIRLDYLFVQNFTLNRLFRLPYPLVEKGVKLVLTHLWTSFMILMTSWVLTTVSLQIS